MAKRTVKNVDVAKQKVLVRVVVIGIAVTVVIHLILVYILPQIGFNPFRIAPFPAQWWIFIVFPALPGLFVIELEEFLFERFKWDLDIGLTIWDLHPVLLFWRAGRLHRLDRFAMVVIL
jgi:hypothetical protein